MPIEPTLLERQRLAFAYLREHAAHAHVAGDGLLANLLCHTGLDRALRLADAKRLLLPLAELAWMPIFALYWLVNPHERSVVEEVLKKLPRFGDEDTAVCEWLNRHAYLIEQPLSGDAEHSRKLIALPWPAFFTKHSAEAETLITHLIELTWFRSPGEGEWEKAAQAWEKAGPSWVAEIIRPLRKRLAAQIRLTMPGKKCPLFPESSAEELRHESDFAELWLLHLYGRSEKVCAVVERLTPGVSGDSHQWRILGDFAYMDDRTDRSGESDSVHLARRRRLSADTPLLIFHDKREQEIENLLGKIFRAQREEMASQRWGVFTLAMLHELSALRLWDYGMWRDAIRAQSEGLLESMQWTEKHPDMAMHALVLAVHGMAARDPDKDRITRRVIDVLEFAPADVLARLAERLLATYPLQKHSATELLDDITDLLPPSVWPELAHWTVSYAGESDEWRSTGQRLAPAIHWLWALLAVPRDSPVWTTLLPQALRIARVSHCWHSGETRSFLLRWFACAPTTLVREVGEAMVTHPENNAVLCVARTELLIDLEERREDLRGVFTARLLSSVHSPGEGLRLARHLALPDVPQREEAVRERVAMLIREAIVRATPPADANATRVDFPSGVELVKTWRLEDKSLLEELIAAVNMPTVLAANFPGLLIMIQLLISNGPVEFAQFVRPHVASWTRELPRGRPNLDTNSGPFSIMHFSGTDAGEIALCLGWLVFQLPRKLGPVAHSELLAWAKVMLLPGHTEPLKMVVYAGVIVALGSPIERRSEALSLTETALLSLWTKATDETNAAHSLAKALGYLAGLFCAEDAKFADWNSESVRAGLECINDLFERFLPRFSRSPRSVLRASVAELLYQLARRQPLSSGLAEALTNLGRDNRARVRFEAQGGWRELRKSSATKSIPIL